MAVNLSRITVFNTGRQYSDKGQRIACTVLPDGRVMFADVDRNIDGITKRECVWNSGVEQYVKEFVMAEYDYGRISYGYYEPGKTPEYNENMHTVMQALISAANAI